MTALASRFARTPTSAARGYAVVTWAYAAGFGVPAVPVAVHLLRRGTLPWFGDLFPMYGGPWSGRLESGPFVGLLLGYAGLTALVSLAASRVGRGSRRGVRVSLVLLPAEAVFWVGLALPIPWIVGAARLVLLVRAARGPVDSSRTPISGGLHA